MCPWFGRRLVGKEDADAEERILRGAHRIIDNKQQSDEGKMVLPVMQSDKSDNSNSIFVPQLYNGSAAQGNSGKNTSKQRQMQIPLYY